MTMMEGEKNKDLNRIHYENIYSRHSISNTISWLNNLENYIKSATETETSWHAIYSNNFKKRIKGKKIVEIGCGDCTNAAVMAALGGEVYANDLAPSSGAIVKKLNENFNFKYPIKFIDGDFLDNKLQSQSFDFVIGKAFLHHLTIPEEKKFLKESARLLKPEGEARFFEPAVNSKILDEIRWYFPVQGRPSKFLKKNFKKWRETDPHPVRNMSSDHWERVGSEYFGGVEIFPVGALERFSRIMKWGKKRENFRRKALQFEKHLPYVINKKFARSQLIRMYHPMQE